MSELLTVSGASFVVAAVAMVITAVVARRVDRVSVVDVTWGVGLTAISVVCAVLGTSGTGWLPWLMVLLVAVWGLRLSWHIWQRSRGHGEDPRYAELLAPHSPDADRSAWFAAAVRKVFVIQGAAVFFGAHPPAGEAVAESDAVAAWAVSRKCCGFQLGSVTIRAT